MKIRKEWDPWDSLHQPTQLIRLYGAMQQKLKACQTCDLCEKNGTFGVGLTADTKNQQSKNKASQGGNLNYRTVYGDRKGRSREKFIPLR